MEEQNKGLWNEIGKNPTQITLDKSKFTTSVFKEMLYNFYKKPSENKRKIIVHTNEAGMFLFNLALIFGEYQPKGIRYWIETYKKVKQMAQISLFEKHGLYKIKVFSEHTHGEFRFYFYYGTKLLFISNTAEDYKLLNYKGVQTSHHIKRKNEL